MAQRVTVSLREAVRIEGRATFRTTKTRFVPRLADSLHLVIIIPLSCELEIQTINPPAPQNTRSWCNAGTAVFHHPIAARGCQ